MGTEEEVFGVDAMFILFAQFGDVLIAALNIALSHLQLL